MFLRFILNASGFAAEYRHPGKDFQLLPKTILGLSEVLVSDLYGGGGVINLKEEDEELIQQVIDNLKSLINRGRKVESSTCYMFLDNSFYKCFCMI